MTYKTNFYIGAKRVGKNTPVFVVAEAGLSHFGDIEKAMDLIDLAVESGADAFKTQAFSVKHMISNRLTDWVERMKEKEVSFDFIEKMKSRCDEKGILFLCTAHDDIALEWVDRLKVSAYKIGSGERNNNPLFIQLAERGKPIILSTGMYTEAHVVDALRVFAEAGCTELALLHCVTSYPTPLNQVNLRAIDLLKDIFPGPVGYSDHTETHDAVLAAVARGATIIEKHISIDFNVSNSQDWKVSCGPHDFGEFVLSIRQVEKLLGERTKTVQVCEDAALHWALKSLVAVTDLPAGTVLSVEHLSSKRPGDGLSPSHLDEVLGRKLRHSVRRDQPITSNDLL